MPKPSGHAFAVGLIMSVALSACAQTTTPAPVTPDPGATGSGAAPPAATSLSWERVDAGPSPPPRQDHSLVADASGARLYLFGGRSGQPLTPLNDLWVLDIASSTWSATDARGPAPRFGHNAAFLGGKLVVFGGQGGPSTFFNDVWEFDPSASAWSEAVPPGGRPQPRYGAGDAVIDGSLVVSHGFTNQGRFDDTWSLDGAWSDLSPASGERPQRRCLLRMVHLPGSGLVLFGGQSNEAPFLGDTWIFDTTSRTWSQAGGLAPEARNLYVFAAHGEVAYLFGGRGASGPSNDLWAFEEGSWKALSPEGTAPEARSAAGGAVVSDSILVFGGAGASGQLNDLWKLSLP